MNRYIQSATILFAALSVIGCNKVEDFNSNPDSALQIESVGGVSQYALMQAQPASKAVIDGNTLPGSEADQGIGIFVTAKDGSAYAGKTSGYSNVKYTYNDEKWSTATPIYLSNTVGKLYGYFPYNAGATDLKAVPVASSLNGTDYLYAVPQEVSISEKSVSLQMNHALARLHLTLKKGEKYNADGVISGITLKSTAIDATGTMDVTTGKVSSAKAADVKGVVELAASGSLSTGDQTYDILLVPAYASDAATPFDILISIDGATAGVTLSGENGITVQSGKQYDVTLEIQDSGIKVASVGVGLWGDGGSQTVQVNGHTVTVKLNEEFDGIVKDIIANAYEDNGDVIIKAMSVQKRVLSCNIGGSAQCQRVKDNDIYTFTISNISSNVEAVLGYSIVSISVKSDDSKGKVWIGDDESKTSGQFYSGQQVVIHAAPNDKFRFFKWNDNNRETNRTIIVTGEADAEYSTSFISSDLIPGLFTVNSSGKQVFFSKGNLWYGKLNGEDAATFHLESNQYESTPSTDKDRDTTHISHFMWCSTAEKAMALNYNNIWDGETPFFAGKDFTVDGVNTWFTLTGGDKGEWKYLIDRKGGTLYKYCVKVCGSANCLILLPDDWKWGENGVGSGWLSEYSESTTVKWSTMENAGAVCLPAAGFRFNNYGDANVHDVGYDGLYWSSTPYDSGRAYNLYFDSGNVFPAYDDNRYCALSVRLVTDVK